MKPFAYRRAEAQAVSLLASDICPRPMVGSPTVKRGTDGKNCLRLSPISKETKTFDFLAFAISPSIPHERDRCFIMILRRFDQFSDLRSAWAFCLRVCRRSQPWLAGCCENGKEEDSNAAAHAAIRIAQSMESSSWSRIDDKKPLVRRGTQRIVTRNRNSLGVLGYFSIPGYLKSYEGVFLWLPLPAVLCPCPPVVVVVS